MKFFATCSMSRSGPKTMIEPPVATSSNAIVPVELRRRHARARTRRRSAPPWRPRRRPSRAARATVMPERELVDAGLGAVAGNAEELEAGRLLRADGFEPVRALRQDRRHPRQRLDVVDDGRLAEEAGVDRERRAVARLAAMPFERLDERRLFAADVGAGAHADLDVEVETGGAAARPSRAGPPGAAARARHRGAGAGRRTRRAGRGCPSSRRSRAPRWSCPRTRGRRSSERSTRSLNVPGSPSSALQTTYFDAPARSAPPRPGSTSCRSGSPRRRGPRRFEAATSPMMSARLLPIAALSPVPGSIVSNVSGVFLLLSGFMIASSPTRAQRAQPAPRGPRTPCGSRR